MTDVIKARKALRSGFKTGANSVLMSRVGLLGYKAAVKATAVGEIRSSPK